MELQTSLRFDLGRRYVVYTITRPDQYLVNLVDVQQLTRAIALNKENLFFHVYELYLSVRVGE
ncbi:hypothetical protein D3C81_2083950 [compost metagenome]